MYFLVYCAFTDEQKAAQKSDNSYIHEYKYTNTFKGIYLQYQGSILSIKQCGVLVDSYHSGLLGYDQILQKFFIFVNEKVACNV